MAQQLQIKSKQGHITVGDVELDVICSDFGNHIFLLISEHQKLGTLLAVSQNQMTSSGSSRTYSIRTLLGKDEPQVHVFGRAIAGHLPLPPDCRLLLGLGLRDHTPNIIPTLLKELEQFRIRE